MLSRLFGRSGPSLTTVFMGLGVFAGGLYLASMKKGTSSGPAGAKILGDGVRKGMRFEASTSAIPTPAGAAFPAATQVFLALGDPQQSSIAGANSILASIEGSPIPLQVQVPTTAVTRIL